jgi:ribosomal protein L34
MPAAAIDRLKADVSAGTLHPKQAKADLARGSSRAFLPRGRGPAAAAPEARFARGGSSRSTFRRRRWAVRVVVTVSKLRCRPAWPRRQPTPAARFSRAARSIAKDHGYQARIDAERGEVVLAGRRAVRDAAANRLVNARGATGRGV